MATARESALEILPFFSENVLKGVVRSYGYYASKIGRNPAKESMIVGPPMHAIGAICVIAGVPVAPLYFVEREDKTWQGVFEGDPLESIHVLPHYSRLYVVARENKYTEEDFQRIGRGLREVIPNDWTPHFMWHYAIVNKPKDSEQTYFERALEKYNELFEVLRREKQNV